MNIVRKLLLVNTSSYILLIGLIESLYNELLHLFYFNKKNRMILSCYNKYLFSSLFYVHFIRNSKKTSC